MGQRVMTVHEKAFGERSTYAAQIIVRDLASDRCDTTLV